MTNCEAIRQWKLDSAHRADPSIDEWRKGCGLDKLQPVIDAVV
jgi:hypothetical protein